MIVRIACVQLNAQPSLDLNLDAAAALIRQAAASGAKLIATPENTSGMYQNSAALMEAALPEAGHPGVARFAALARETGAWLLAGSMAIKLGDDSQGAGKLANRSFLFDPTGAVAVRYDKIHMFDSDPGDGQAYRESATYEPGDRAVVVDTPFGGLGLTICYDVRFAGLYAALARAGASIIMVPAAFTVPTGMAHWQVLLRARAIETGCFVAAPAQTGEHAGGRRTYGHSLIISPWGEILAEGCQEPGIVMADCDLDRIPSVRKMVRALHHVRLFAAPVLSDKVTV